MGYSFSEMLTANQKQHPVTQQKSVHVEEYIPDGKMRAFGILQI